MNLVKTRDHREGHEIIDIMLREYPDRDPVKYSVTPETRELTIPYGQWAVTHAWPEIQPEDFMDFLRHASLQTLQDGFYPCHADAVAKFWTYIGPSL